MRDYEQDMPEHAVNETEPTPGELVRRLEELRLEREKLAEVTRAIDLKIANAEEAVKGAIGFLQRVFGEEARRER